MFNATISGNLGKDPELKSVNGQPVASFSLAVKTNRDQTEWFNCSVWGNRSKTVLDYFKKGSRVTVIGAAKIRNYEKKDGTPAFSLELNVTDFTLPSRSEPTAEAPTTNDLLPPF